MLSLLSLYPTVFWVTFLQKCNFSSMFQSNLDPPLNTKSVHNYVIELLQKFGDSWGSCFYVMNFCSFLPNFTPFARIDVVLMSNV
jgi:hypothetical protein